MVKCDPVGYILVQCGTEGYFVVQCGTVYSVQPGHVASWYSVAWACGLCRHVASASPGGQ